jgi:alpha-galactosidase
MARPAQNAQQPFTFERYNDGRVMPRFLIAFLFTAGLLLAADSARFESCYAHWDGTTLTIGNSHIERQWQLRDSALHPSSFRDLSTSAEWLAGTSVQPAPSGGRASSFAFSAKTGAPSPVSAGALTVELTSPAVTYRFRIYPEAHGVTVQVDSAAPRTASASAPAAGQPTGVETAASTASAPVPDLLDSLDLAAGHVRLTQVTLLDQTDVHNELVFENEWLLQTNERALRLSGNLFIVENTLTRSGLIFLKLAPLPHARPVKEDWDLQAHVEGQAVRCLFAGGHYAGVVLAYTGGRPGRTEVLQRFQRQLRRFDPRRDARFLSNTWGDRSRDARINAAFMQAEIAAGAQLGVDVIQIDDGWQHGRTANSARGAGVWNGYWASDPNFWQPDAARFPAGLAPLVKQAAGAGMRFGLWFGPDSSNDFTNWRRDAARILELHRTEGIDYVKIDSVKALSPTGERNLRRFFDTVLEASQGQVTFDLDVTAEIRPGYFGLPDVGPIFVENRYTDSRRYWPHQTLRNLWKLAAYVDPLRLRMEFLNNARQQSQYTGDPLAPAAYSPATLFATVMFSNPLGWFETSNLPDAYVAETARLVAVWKQHRAAIFSGTILPIGQAPDGTNWSGFLSFSSDRRSGYVLIFRGLTESATWSESLPIDPATTSIEVLGGAGRATLDHGRLHVELPAPRGFLFARIGQ